MNCHRTYHDCIIENVHGGLIRVLGIWYKSPSFAFSLKHPRPLVKLHVVFKDQVVSQVVTTVTFQESGLAGSSIPEMCMNPLLHFKKNNKKQILFLKIQFEKALKSASVCSLSLSLSFSLSSPTEQHSAPNADSLQDASRSRSRFIFWKKVFPNS